MRNDLNQSPGAWILGVIIVVLLLMGFISDALGVRDGIGSMFGGREPEIIERVVEVTREVPVTQIVEVAREVEVTRITEVTRIVVVESGAASGVEADPALEAPSSTTLVPISSYFDRSNIDGWRVDYGSLSNPGASGNTGNQEDGHLRTSPPGDNHTSYFIAPNQYNGDWRGFSELRIDLWSTGGEYFANSSSARGDIFIANGDLTAQLSLPRRPAESWDTFRISIHEERWDLGVGTMSVQDVFANVGRATHFL